MKRIFAALTSVVMLFSSCGKKNSLEAVSISNSSGNSSSVLELVCLVETEEEAKMVAQSYKVEFISFSNGVAVFSTKETINDILERGEALNLPKVLGNLEYKSFN